MWVEDGQTIRKSVVQDDLTIFEGHLTHLSLSEVMQESNGIPLRSSDPKDS